MIAEDAPYRQAVEYFRAALQQPNVRPPGVKGAGRSAISLASEKAIADGVVDSDRSFRHRLEKAAARGLLPADISPFPTGKVAPAFTVAQPPEAASKSVEQIIAERHAAFHRKKSGDTFRKAIDVQIHEPGPFGLCFFGDPHLDNDGTNWPLLQAHIDAVRATPQMFACAIGDYRDNWIGRLQALYGKGGATVDEGVKLLEWFCNSISWLALSPGNHDHWGSMHGDVFELIKRISNIPGSFSNDDMRFVIRSPNGAEVTLRMRHQFPGQSMYSPGHGVAKEAMMGLRDHILVGGHTHSADLRTVWHEGDQRLCIGLQLGAYKQVDEYAIERGFPQRNWTPNMAVVVDPDRADDPRRFITAFWDLEEACDYLAFKRQRFDEGKRS